MTGAVYLIVLGVVVAGYIWLTKNEYERQLTPPRPSTVRVIPPEGWKRTR